MAMKAVFTYIALLCAMAIQANESTESERVEAQQAWERAIEAKGGRSRLSQVKNFVLSSTALWGIPGINQIRLQYERLLVPPSLLWEYSDERPTNFGLALRIVDLDRQFAQMIYGGANGPLAADRPSIGDIQHIRELQAIILLETQGLLPQPVSTKRDVGFLRSVQVVTTVIDDQIFEFHLQPGTHLPVRVMIKTKTPHGTHVDEYRLAEYRTVEGLQLPHEISKVIVPWKPPHKEKITYQLNVRYDEKIFRQAPSLARGPDGWKPMLK